MSKRILLLLLSIILFQACKKDQQPEAEPEATLIGKWYWEKQVYGNDTYTDFHIDSYFEFKPDGVFIEYSANGDRTLPGRYRLSEDKKSVTTIRDRDRIETEYAIKRLDSEYLVLNAGYEYTLSKKTGELNSYVEITVLDATGRTIANPVAAASPNAAVSLYKSKEDLATNKPAYTGTTGSDGKCRISVPDRQELYLKVSNGNAAMTSKGYLIEGIFTSEDQIQYYARQSAEVGGLILFDFNGDGVVDISDKRDFHTLWSPKKNQTKQMTVYISQ